MNYEEWIQSWFDQVWKMANGSVLEASVSDPFNFHLSGGRSFTLSHEDYLSYLGVWHQRFKDVDFTVKRTIQDSDKCAVIYSCDAVYHGGWLRIPSRRQKVHMTGILWFEFKDGVMTDCWLEDSDFDLYQQLTGYLE